ncbi:MAG: tRNA dihydrouridine synthase DusB [Ignavibacteriales bacterium]|nr:tRNA dihydrouridine synthase DusB [Ignavibacteriales bacterium]
MKIGTINIEKPLLLAPMENVTDLPFRLVCKRMGVDILFTEFINSDGLVRNSKKTKHKMSFEEEERPIGIQIYGSDECAMEGAAELAVEMDPDILDINCGCWVKDVAMRGAGAGLLKDLPRMERIVKGVVSVSTKPVTVKTRLGWDETSIRIIEVAQMLEQCGVKALTIHCRTRSQGHKGDPDFSWIPEIKRHVSIPIIVNGGIMTPEDVVRVFDDTGCDGVMIARGAIDNPWLFKQAKEILTTGTYTKEISWEERVAVSLEHLALSIQYKGDRTGVLEMRKHYSGYFRGIPNISKLRNALVLMTDVDQIVEAIRSYEIQPLEQTTQFS